MFALIAGDTINGNEDNDLIFGDHGKIEAKDKLGREQKIDASLLPLNLNLDPALMLTPDVRPVHPFTWTSIDTLSTDGGGADLIRGNAGDDIILGGQGGDRIIGGAGDDDITGGHNGNLVAGDGLTDNNLGGHDGDDLIDAGAGDDAVAGDNADLLRTGAPISVRMRVLTGEVIYDGDGNALVTGDAQRNPTGAVERFVRLYDHNDAPLALTSGNDAIAGGADDDVIFGQLGDDVIQGDGSVIAESGNLTVNAGVTRLSVEDLAGIATDGDDYIEGNGGDDLIFGNLGQDDLIGDNSDRFSLIAAAMRPAGSDTIFGGAGTRTERNDTGSGDCGCEVTVDGHSRDADVVLGDNGNIFRLVGTSGTALAQAAFLTFNYDDSAVGHKIVPRAYVLLYYTQGARGPSDRGTDDLLHGEAGDDTIHGMTGNDVAFGEGQNDNIYGGSGYDRLYGGTGADGILGDDGKIRTSRNGLIEPLNSLFTANAQTLLETRGPFIGAVVNITGDIHKIVDLAAFELGSADVIYGGLGCDFLHGGAGDDAISGAEAERAFYTEAPQTLAALGYDPANPLGYDPATRKLAAYDADEPRTKIEGFLLNFDNYRIDESTGAQILVAGAPIKSHDGSDRIFGDLGNDWLVGGTGADRMFGGRGDDYLNTDDNLDTNGGLNDQPDAPLFADGDFAFGGAGLDVLMANTGNDRLFDWTGEFNSFIVPFSPFGAPTVNRMLSPHVKDFIQDLATGEGADPTIFEPNGEIGLVDQDDPDWNDQHGGPRDPQPGNIGGVKRDTQGAPEDMANPPGCGCDFSVPVSDGVQIVKAVNGQDANAGTGPQVVVDSTVTWTYQVRNTGDEPLSNLSIVDDGGTTGTTVDDFVPTAVAVVAGGVSLNVGDTDRDNQLNVGETWLYTATGTATAGAYVNVARVTALDQSGQTYTDDDPARYFGIGTPTGSIRIEKAINAVDPTNPTPAEDADSAPGPTLQVGTSITWSYQVFNDGTDPIEIASIIDDFGTPTDTSDDFTPLPVLSADFNFNIGDSDQDNLPDAGETWRFTSVGTAAGNYQAVAGAYRNDATVIGTVIGINAVVQDDDPSHYFGSQTPSVADLHLVKAVNAVSPLSPTVTEDANNPAAPVVVPAGSTVVFTYAVSNTGDDALETVTLVDDNGTAGTATDDFAPAPVTVKFKGKYYNTGDANHNKLLDETETWLFSATRVAGEGAYTNFATVTAVNTRTNVTVVDDDPANVFGAVAGIDVEKAINAFDPADPTIAEDADDASQPVVLYEGASVTWTYLLSNTGNVPLKLDSIVDDAGTPGVTSDDFTPAPLLDADFNVGDLDRNNLLDLGEVWRFTSAGTTAGSATVQLGLHTNTVTAVGTDARVARTVSDFDTASYLGEAGLIRIEKAINAAHPQAPTRYEDADFATGPILQVGAPIVWTYQVFNLSDVALDIIDLVDTDGFPLEYVGGDVGVDGGVADGRLDPEEVWLFTSPVNEDGVGLVPATAGQHVNTVTVKAMDDAGNIFVDDDQAHYFGTGSGTGAGINIVKAINAVDAQAPTEEEDANDPLHPVMVQEGAIPTFTYQVRNLGTSALTDVTILDDAATDLTGDDFVPAPVTIKFKGKHYNTGDVDRDGLLDTSETWLYTSAGVYQAAPQQGAYINVTQATATDVNTGINVREDDTANFIVTAVPGGAGRMTGGGSVFTVDDMRVTHGFTLHSDINVGPNNLQVNFDGNRFHLEQLTSIASYDDPLLDPLPRPAPFDTLVGEGIGRFNGVSGYRVWFNFTDNGEPGKKDHAHIEIRDPQGNLVLFVSGNLHNGNHQAHPENQLQAAAARAMMRAAVPILEASQLAQSTEAAKRAWAEAGASAEQIGRLDAIQLAVADLPGLTLGEAQDGVITIDADAAGHGWFVDSTPLDGSEFALLEGDSLLVADATSDAYGRIDLLSVVIHEMGHVLGLEHDEGVMTETLATGVRLLPEEQETDVADVLTVPILVGGDSAEGPDGTAELLPAAVKDGDPSKTAWRQMGSKPGLVRLERLGAEEIPAASGLSAATLLQIGPMMAITINGNKRAMVAPAWMDKPREQLFDTATGVFGNLETEESRRVAMPSLRESLNEDWILAYEDDQVPDGFESTDGDVIDWRA